MAVSAIVVNIIRRANIVNNACHSFTEIQTKTFRVHMFAKRVTVILLDHWMKEFVTQWLILKAKIKLEPVIVRLMLKEDVATSAKKATGI